MRLLKTAILNIAALAARLLPASLKKQLYRSSLLARSIRRSLNTAAPSGVTPVLIAGGSIRGLTMALDLQKEKDYWLGTYEPELQAALERFIQPGDVVYDVGANIGYISLIAGFDALEVSDGASWLDNSRDTLPDADVYAVSKGKEGVRDHAASTQSAASPFDFFVDFGPDFRIL